MPHDIQLTQINVNIFGIGRANTVWGFPSGTDFHTMVMSFWMCGPVATPPSTGSCAIWPAFMSAGFFGFGPGVNGIQFTNAALGSAAHFYQGTFALPLAGCLSHVLLSVDTHAQVVQLYINDLPVPITGETWTGAQPLDFNIANTANIWFWDVAGVIGSGRYPAMADAWISHTPDFVDLSVEANRRRFINRNLTPVDLGDTGTNPFGFLPALYMSVRSGGVPTDLGINRGVGGGTWNFSGGGAEGTVPTFQAPGSCTLPIPPEVLRLAMDDVVCTIEPDLEQNLISLRWSDNRGHSYGSPVSKNIGAVGQYRTSLQWLRLGYARDRMFEVSWSVPMPTALKGCWFDAAPGQS
jgi:hypothetical protein